MKLNNKLKYVIPMIITALLLCVIYVIKGIYPFGVKTIDYYDMAQQIAAFYYHVFDFLHGEKNLFYDPYTAMGVNMAMSTSGCSHLSIFNLFFLFVKREMLLESFSIFLMIKMMVMSLFMYIYIHSRYKISFVFEVMLSVGYAFCGYVLTLYMTIQWLDVAALFPLLMYFLHKLLKEGKIAGYTLILTMSIIASYYQTFMILIYIVLMLGAVLFVDKVFKNSKKIYENYHLIRLLVSTMASIGLSGFILMPQMVQTLLSARFNNESEGGLFKQYLSIVSNVRPAYTSRWWTLLLTSFLFSIIILGLWRYRKDRKTTVVVIISLFIVLSEFVVEGVNLFWHFGSYVGYPIRNGYMICFTLAVIACGFLEKLEDDKAIKTSNEKGSQLLEIGIVAAAAVVCLIVTKIYSISNGLFLRDVFHITSAIMAFSFVIYTFLAIYKEGKWLFNAPILFCAEIILFGFIMIGAPSYISSYTEDPEQEGEYIRICGQLDDKFDLNCIENSGESEENLIFSRIKNPDTSLNANYGLVLRRPVLSNWTHLLSPKLQRDASKLGYSVQYTRLLDSGGTVFSDALLGIRDIISTVPMDEKLYDLFEKESVIVDHITGEQRTFYHYKSKYTLPYGIAVDRIDYDFENGDVVSIYNEMYQSVNGNRDVIADYCFEKVLNTTKDEIIEKELDVSGNKALYLFTDQIDTDDCNIEITVNGKSILVPSIGDYENLKYPAHFNNNAVYLGTFSDEKSDIRINISNIDSFGNELDKEITLKIISIDMDKMADLVTDYSDCITNRAFDKSRYIFSIDNKTNSSYLIIPVSYDEGYKALVNGTVSEAMPVGGIFTAVPISTGQSEVILNFVPKGMKEGSILSVISTIILVIFVLLLKKKDIFDKDYLWLSNLYIAGFVAAMMLMYLVPYVFAGLTYLHIL